MAELLDLPVEWNVIFVFQQEQFQHTGMFLANPSVTVPIHPVRFNHHFNYRQSLQEFAVTSGFLLLSIGLYF